MLPTTTTMTSRRGTSRTSLTRATNKKSSSSFSFPQHKGRWEAKIVRVLALWTIVLLLSNLCFAAFFSSSSSSSSSLRGGDDAASKHEARVRRRRAKNLAPEDLKFIGQVTSLLEEPVPISLSKRRLRSNLEFTCGGSHVVKMHKYQEMKKQSGVGLLNALANEDWFTEGVDLEDAAADGGEERNTDDADDALGGGSSGDSSSSSSEQKRKKKRYKSCAVVGNSGSLLETQFGFDIDKNEAVIRFNAAVTQGYEQFVGQKTTVRLLNAVDYKGPEGTEDELRLTTARGSDVKVWVKKLEQKPEEMRNKSFVLDPEMLCHAWAWIGKHGEKPSSGLVGVVLALKMCEKVEMFGFQSKNYFGKFSRPHYYDWERPQKGREKVHPFQREVDLYQSLERFGYLTTYT
jgi:hypothetical protein